MDISTINTDLPDMISRPKISILGCWEMRDTYLLELSPITEVEEYEFRADGTGTWTQRDTSGLEEVSTDTFTYQLQGRKVTLFYDNMDYVEEYDYRISKGHLVLIEGLGMRDDDYTVYTRKGILPEIEFCRYGNEKRKTKEAKIREC